MAQNPNPGDSDLVKHESAIQCDGLMSLEKSRLTDYVGELTSAKLRELDTALQCKAFCANVGMDGEYLVNGAHYGAITVVTMPGWPNHDQLIFLQQFPRPERKQQESQIIKSLHGGQRRGIFPSKR